MSTLSDFTRVPGTPNRTTQYTSGSGTFTLHDEVLYLTKIVNDLHELSLAESAALTIKKEPVKPLSEDQIRGFSIKREVSLKGKSEKVREDVEKTFQKTLGFKFAESRDEGGLQIHAQKGSFPRLGVYITHVSILVILAGAIAGIFLGFKGFLNLPEGRVYSVAFARTGQLTPMGEAERDRILDAVEGSAGNLQNAARQIGIDEGFLRQKMKQYGIQPLGFMIRCDDFTVEFYGTTEDQTKSKRRIKGAPP